MYTFLLRLITVVNTAKKIRSYRHKTI